MKSSRAILMGKPMFSPMTSTSSSIGGSKQNRGLPDNPNKRSTGSLGDGKVKLDSHSQIISFEEKIPNSNGVITEPKSSSKKEQQTIDIPNKDAFVEEYSSPAIDISNAKVKDKIPEVEKLKSSNSETIQIVKKVAIGTGISLALKYLINKLM